MGNPSICGPVICALWACFTLFQPATSRAADLPAEAFLSVPLDAFFAGQTDSGQNKPLNLYLVRRDGRWASALATATLKGKPIWNTALMPVDASALETRDDRISGRLSVTLVPDPWVPADRQVRTATIEMDARRTGTAGPSPEFEGSWRSSIPGDPRVLAAAGLRDRAEGRFRAALGAAPVHELTDVSYDLVLYDFLPTPHTEAYHGRLAFSLGIRNSRICSARLGQLDIRQRPYDYAVIPLPSSDATSGPPPAVSQDYFGIQLPMTLTDLEGEDRRLILRLEGRRVAGWLVGKWSTDDGRQGWFRGNANPGAHVPETTATPADSQPWFVAVPGHSPVAPGEHPRLFFRKTDLPELRRRAETPEGQAILRRLRELLDGSNGDGPPLDFNPATRAYEKNKFQARPGSYSLSHAAGYGFLYQLSGDSRYAALARECVDAALSGRRNHDDRYAFVSPGGELRAAPVLGWTAAAYDLCYDAWPEDYRRRVALALQDYSDTLGGEWNKPEGITLHRMVLTQRQGPASNHFGAVVGGCGLTVLALLGDPGTDQARLERYLTVLERNVVRHLSAGWGDGGYFAEGWGASRVSSQGAFLPFLQAMRTARGRDYLNSEHPNATYITMIPRTHLVVGPPAVFPYRSSMDGSYGRPEIGLPAERAGFSAGGYFSEGFGAIADRHKPALLWTYQRLFADVPYDLGSLYPHRAMLALINWPSFSKIAADNPAGSLPLALRDHIHDHFAFRNRFRDADDILATVMLRVPTGTRPREIMVWGYGGLRLNFGEPPRGARVRHYRAGADGSALLATTEDWAMAVDYSGASGADALIVKRGGGDPPSIPPAAGSRARLLRIGPYDVLTLAPEGRHPEPKILADESLEAGGQRLRLSPDKEPEIRVFTAAP